MLRLRRLQMEVGVYRSVSQSLVTRRTDTRYLDRVMDLHSEFDYNARAAWIHPARSVNGPLLLSPKFRSLHSHKQRPCVRINPAACYNTAARGV